MSEPRQDFQSIKEVKIYFNDGSVAVSHRFDRTAEAVITQLLDENKAQNAEIERLNRLVPKWNDIASAPTGHFIGYHKTKQGLVIIGGIWVVEGEARFESGIGNRPTHWCEYPKYPDCHPEGMQ